MHWVNGATEGGRAELMFAPHEWDTYAVVAVSLLTCRCRGGVGHRVMANPTGASLSLSVWEKGRACLERRGIIEP